jgi:hypothetical protein
MIDHSLTGVALSWKAPQTPPGSTGQCGFNTNFVFSRQTWNLTNDPRAHPLAGSFTDRFTLSLTADAGAQVCPWRICTPYSMGALVETGGDESATYYLENTTDLFPTDPSYLSIGLGFYIGQFWFQVVDSIGFTVIRTDEIDGFNGVYYVSCCYSPPDPPSGLKSSYMRLYINSWRFNTIIEQDSTVGTFLSAPEFSVLDMVAGLDVDYLGGFSDKCNCGSAPADLLYAKNRGGVIGQRDKVIRQQNLLRRMLASLPATPATSSLTSVRSCAGCYI